LTSGTKVVEVDDVVELDVVEDSATTEVLVVVSRVVEVVEESGTVVVDASVSAIVVGVTPTVVVGATGSSRANSSEQTKSCLTSSAARAGETGNMANTATHERSTHSMRVEDAKRVRHSVKGVVCTPYKVGT
jgi:hypothetical protein